MEIVRFLNEIFWRDSGYMLLTVLATIFLLVNKNEDSKGKIMAIYTLLCLILIIYNPFVAKKALRFFGDDMYAYLRIFYLLPLMTLIPYALTKIYCSLINGGAEKKKKIYVIVVLSAIVALSGGVYGKSMYTNVTNVYKINQDALEISDVIAENCGEERVAIYVTYEDEVFYGIRQYSKNIMIVGNSDEIASQQQLYDAKAESDFSYYVLDKHSDMNSIVTESGFQDIGESENYIIYKRI